jgi:hypothetical protein
MNTLISEYKISKAWVIKKLIIPLSKKGYKLEIVGGIKNKGFSYHDIDILLTLPSYPKADFIFKRFDQDLGNIGFWLDETFENDKYGIFHNYQYDFNILHQEIGLDIFIKEI